MHCILINHTVTLNQIAYIYFVLPARCWRISLNQKSKGEDNSNMEEQHLRRQRSQETSRRRDIKSTPDSWAQKGWQEMTTCLSMAGTVQREDCVHGVTTLNSSHTPVTSSTERCIWIRYHSLGKPHPTDHPPAVPTQWPAACPAILVWRYPPWPPLQCPLSATFSALLTPYSIKDWRQILSQLHTGQDSNYYFIFILHVVS